MRKNKVYRFLLLFCPLTLLTLACGHNTAEQADSRMPSHFTEYCAPCHGKDLRGEVAQSLLDGSWQFGARTNDIFRSIKFGHPQYGMPSWSAVLQDEEIEQLVAFLLEEEERLGVTKAPIPDTLETLDYRINVDIIAEELETPWSINFTGPGRILVTERPGRLRIIENGILRPDSVLGLPAVRDGGQAGLFDVAIDPGFEQNGWIYLAFSHGLPADNTEEPAPAMTSIVRGRILDNTWTDQEVIFEAPHDSYRTANQHFGGRITFDSQGYLFFSIGDRGASDHAQDLSRPNGKIHRIHRDGRIPHDNPFYGQKDVIQSIFSYGHRNPQGLVIHPETDQLWETEHGPLGGDELNLVEKGLNYGWPEITYGLNYNGTIVSDKFQQEGMEQPILYWKPSIAACGLDFYSGDLFPKWKNRLLAGGLKIEEVQLLDVVNDRVIYQQTILKNAGRVRDVKTGPDGAIYVVLNRPGTILRLTPESAI